MQWFYRAATAVAFLILMALLVPVQAADKGGKEIVTLREAEALHPKTPWSSCYAGVSLGVTAAVLEPIYGVDGYRYDGFGGCTGQWGRLVAGLEAGYGATHVTIGNSSFDPKEWYFAGLGGFLLTEKTLAYVKVSRPELEIEGTKFRGLGLGGGMETLVTPPVGLRLEYMRETFDDIQDARAHVLRAGIVWRFNMPTLTAK